MRFLQVNLDRRRAAHDLVFAYAKSTKIDILLISEPNQALCRNKGWYLDECMDACIININQSIKVYGWGGGQGFAWIKMEDLCVYSCYFSPNRSQDEFEDFVRALEDNTIKGDFNTKSPMWGSPRADGRGDSLAEWALNKNLIPLNTGDCPTFQRGEQFSYIDVTFAGEAIVNRITNWRASEEETLSLHNYITFNVEEKSERCRPKRQKSGTLDERKLRNLIRTEQFFENDHYDPEACARVLKKLINQATPRGERRLGNNSVYWWTDEIAVLKELVVYKRRIVTRRRSGDRVAADFQRALIEYKMARGYLKRELKEKKKQKMERVKGRTRK